MRKLFCVMMSASFLLSAGGCATYVENQASLEFEPIYPHADVRTDNGSPTGGICLLYTSPSPRDLSTSRMPSSA